MFDSEKFWDKQAPSYSKHSDNQHNEINSILSGHIKRHLAASDVALEIACGSGTMAVEFAAVVSELVATDISARMVEFAKATAARANVNNVRFLHTTILGESLQAGAFDKVIACRILHLFDRDMEAYLGRTRELLKAGGLFITATPVKSGLSKRLRLFLPLARVLNLLGLFPRFRLFKPADIDKLLSASGLKVVESRLIPDSAEHAAIRADIYFAVAKRA